MDDVRDQFHAGRRSMIEAFVKISDFARRAGVDWDVISECHGEFFDGNVAVKKAFRTTIIVAEIRR